MKRSQIDLLIESDDVCIVIENKIYAEDQKRQLGRYYEYALDTGKEHSIIYLTLGGDEPGEFTLYGGEGEPSEFYGENKIPPCRMLPKDTVVCLSYKKFIHDWLDACIREVTRIPQIRETLHQYQMTVKKLIGQPINRRYAMALKDILLENKNCNLIPDLEAALSDAKFDLKYKFWTELKKRLEERLVKKLRYQVYGHDLGIDEGIEVTKPCIRSRPKGRSPGLTFSFSENKNLEIMFRISHDSDGYYCGFVLCEKGGLKRVAINDTEHEEYLTQEILAGKKEWDNGWLTYKSFNPPEIDLTKCESVEKYEQRNRELVEKIVDEICKFIKTIYPEQEKGAVI